MAEAITGLFALAGVLIAGFLGLIGYKFKTMAELERDFRAKHFNLRFDIYSKAYDFVWSQFQREQLPQNATEVVNQAREISRGLILVGSPAVVRGFHRIPQVSSEKLMAAGMSDEEIRSQQTEAARELFLAIRKDLYPHLEVLRAADIMFIVPRQETPQSHA